MTDESDFIGGTDVVELFDIIMLFWFENKNGERLFPKKLPALHFALSRRL
jgi:hypothetical protein